MCKQHTPIPFKAQGRYPLPHHRRGAENQLQGPEAELKCHETAWATVHFPEPPGPRSDFQHESTHPVQFMNTGTTVISADVFLGLDGKAITQEEANALFSEPGTRRIWSVTEYALNRAKVKLEGEVVGSPAPEAAE